MNRHHIQFLLKTPCGQLQASTSFPSSLSLGLLQLPCRLLIFAQLTSATPIPGSTTV